MDVTEVEGKPLLQLLAGSSWESGRFSETLRVLAEKIKRREGFSNLPLEVEIGGQKRWWELSASPRLDEKGIFLGFRGVGSDITEQRKSYAKLAQLARSTTLTNLPNHLTLPKPFAEQ